MRSNPPFDPRLQPSNLLLAHPQLGYGQPQLIQVNPQLNYPQMALIGQPQQMAPYQMQPTQSVGQPQFIDPQGRTLVRPEVNQIYTNPASSNPVQGTKSSNSSQQQYIQSSSTNYQVQGQSAGQTFNQNQGQLQKQGQGQAQGQGQGQNQQQVQQQGQKLS